MTSEEFRKLADELGLHGDAAAVVAKAFVEVRRRTLQEAILVACGSCAAGLVPVMGRVDDRFVMFPEKWIHVGKDNPQARWTCMAGPLYDKLKELEEKRP